MIVIETNVDCNSLRFATYLIAGGASRLDGFCVVPAAVELSVLVEVDEIDEQLLADGAGEAVGVPAAVGAGPRGADANVPGVDGARTLQSDESKCYCPLLAINASLGRRVLGKTLTCTWYNASRL